MSEYVSYPRSIVNRPNWSPNNSLNAALLLQQQEIEPEAGGPLPQKRVD